jgi:hypothetical protein
MLLHFHSHLLDISPIEMNGKARALLMTLYMIYVHSRNMNATMGANASGGGGASGILFNSEF